jgi:hypothetical protein
MQQRLKVLRTEGVRFLSPMLWWMLFPFLFFSFYLEPVFLVEKLK